jgi:hypothetical protein
VVAEPVNPFWGTVSMDTVSSGAPVPGEVVSAQQSQSLVVYCTKSNMVQDFQNFYTWEGTYVLLCWVKCHIKGANGGHTEQHHRPQ